MLLNAVEDEKELSTLILILHGPGGIHETLGLEGAVWGASTTPIEDRQTSETEGMLSPPPPPSKVKYEKIQACATIKDALPEYHSIPHSPNSPCESEATRKNALNKEICVEPHIEEGTKTL